MKKYILIGCIGIFILILSIGSNVVYETVFKDPVNPSDTSQESPSSESRVISKQKTIKNKIVTPTGPIIDQTMYSETDDDSLDSIEDNPITKNKESENSLNEKDALDQMEGELSAIQEVKNRQEKLIIDVNLFDGEQNQIIKEYEVECRYKFNNESALSESFKTDKTGKFTLKVKQTGVLYILITTKDFALYSTQLIIRSEKNEFKAILLKGGSLEIRATNAENIVVEGLVARMGKDWSLSKVQDFIPIKYEASRGMYFIHNIPVGTQDISFQAKGYLDTPLYRVIVDAKKNALLEVHLQTSRILAFDLLIPSKPDTIFISNPQREKPPRNNNKKDVKDNLEEKIQISKNTSGLFEYELEDRKINRLKIHVEEYLPQIVNIIPDKNAYRVPFVDGYKAEIFIKNIAGDPIQGAQVTYWSTNFKEVAISDEKGLAKLLDLKDAMDLKYIVIHESYVSYSDNWQFDAGRQLTKEITLLEGNKISGKIKIGKQIVGGAKVYLLRKNQNNPSLMTNSLSNGSYAFEHLDDKKNLEFHVKAFHPEKGIAVSEIFKIEEKGQKIDLSLHQQKSAALKILDNFGASVPNAIISFTNRFDKDIFFSITTNEKGEHELFNVVHGNYIVKLEDEKYKLKETSVNIPSYAPNSTLILNAEKINFRKIRVTLPSGALYRGNIKVSVEWNRNSWPLEIKTGEDGNFYVNIQDQNLMRRGIFLFEVQGYASIRLGRYEKLEDFPEEFVIELQEGRNLKIQVVDNKSGRPLPYKTVDIYSDKNKVQSLPTNELGEVTFEHLVGKLTVVLRDDQYVVYRKDLEIDSSNELIVSLIKGGSLKGHITISKSASHTRVSLSKNVYFDVAPDGNFEFFRVRPAEYTITIFTTLKDGRKVVEVIPTKIKIENEKILEVNLDEMLKN